MNIRYIVFAAILVISGIGLFFIPVTESSNEIEPDQLMTELFDQTRYVSTDEVADRIINQDPSLLLIDVRMVDYYSEFSLQGAANIPLEEILSSDWEDYFLQDHMDIIFYSNGDIYAEQAWMLASRMGYENLYIMKGGLNKWFETIIKPVMPAVTSSKIEFELYAFRQGASQYFTGGGLKEANSSVLEPVMVKRKKKSTVIEGGC